MTRFVSADKDAHRAAAAPPHSSGAHSPRSKDVEGNFPELTLEIGRRHRLGTTIVVEWTCNYGDGRPYRNVTIGELVHGTVTHITDYWGNR